jgi:pentapeptide repeat protein
MHRVLFLITLAAAAVVLAYFLLWELPKLQVGTNCSLTEFQRQQLVLDARKTNAQIVGGVALLFGFYFTWRNLKATEEGKITERFTRAVDQLGSDKIEQRVGGIFALERLAKDSMKDHPSIIELICTFLRHRERTKEESEPYRVPVGVREDRDLELARKVQKSMGWAPVAPEDVGAAISVLRRNRQKLRPPHLIDLSGADLRRVNLEGAQLQGANLSSVYGECANFDGADLRDADFGYSDFKMAGLDGADLRGAWIGGAKFQWAELRKADLRDIKIVHKPEYEWGFESDPDIDNAMADHVTVDFKYADLRDALLEGVTLERANLRFANLSTAVGLSYHQIEGAFGNKKTQIPQGISRPSRWETDKEDD